MALDRLAASGPPSPERPADLQRAIQLAQHRIARELQIQPDDARDHVQQAIVELLSAHGPQEPISPALLIMRARSRAIDQIRKNDVRARKEMGDFVTQPEGEISQLEPVVDSYEELDHLMARGIFTAKEAAYLRAVARFPDTVSASQGTDSQAIAESIGTSPVNVRKLAERCRTARAAYTAYRLLTAGRWNELNLIRLTEKEAYRVARLCRKFGAGEEQSREAFRHKDLNRAIQNCTWILSRLHTPQSRGFASVEGFLRDQLQHGDLFRGNKNYISEALLDLGHRNLGHVLRNFLDPLHELQDRITAEDSHVGAALRKRCIYDVKKVKQLRHPAARKRLQQMCQKFESGSGSIDLRRTLAFEILRIQPQDNDDEFVWRLLMALTEEKSDATNVYYVVKYLRNWGYYERPRMFTRDLVDVLDRLADNLPAISYIRESSLVLRSRLGV